MILAGWGSLACTPGKVAGSNISSGQEEFVRTFLVAEMASLAAVVLARS